jgi:tRNA isopentenyl-2-thiomethyl-A-37 hydroxylase MiaE
MQNTTNNVFLNACNAAIVVTVNNVQVAAVYTAAQLAAVFKQHNINVLTDTIMCSSSIDFASEEGFATDSCAHNIIEEAFEALS